MTTEYFIWWLNLEKIKQNERDKSPLLAQSFSITMHVNGH